MSKLDTELERKLVQRQEENRLRTLMPPKNLIDFSSNDYLGLSELKEIQDLSSKIASSYPFVLGGKGSRLISGNHSIYGDFEEWLAHFHGKESALVFNSGYSANLGVFASLPQKGDRVIYDSLSHASIRDGLRLSLAGSFSFKHNDLNHLEDRLKQDWKGNTIIATESIFSMHGDRSPLKEISGLAKKYGAEVWVDEAHATGIIGNAGRGLVDELDLSQEIDLCIHTFGKALGAHGAAVLSSNIKRNFLINYARSFIYTTALPPSSLADSWAAYTYMSGSEKERLSLFANVELFSEAKNNSGPIQVFSGNGQNLSRVQSALEESGFYAKAILPPTVPLGEERIRICIRANHSPKHILSLKKLLKSTN